MKSQIQFSAWVFEAWGQPGWDYGRWSGEGKGCDRKESGEVGQ